MELSLDLGWVLVEGDSDDDKKNDDDEDEDDEEVAADGRDAARPIRQDLSNWVTVDGPLTLHKKSEGDDEFEFSRFFSIYIYNDL